MKTHGQRDMGIHRLGRCSLARACGVIGLSMHRVGTVARGFELTDAGRERAMKLPQTLVHDGALPG
jgi:hypothetical protein